MKVILILFTIWVVPFFHAENIAEYYYQFDDDVITLKFVIENSEASSFTFDNDCNFQKMNALCVFEYLKKNSYIELDKKKINLELQNSYIEKGHLIVNLSAKINIKSIEEITIYNRCFYEFNSNFKNRISLNIKQFQSSYLLTNSKTLIHLN